MLSLIVSTGYVGRKHPTYVTPNDRLLLIYWAVLYLLQIGFSLLLVLGRKPETKVSRTSPCNAIANSGASQAPTRSHTSTHHSRQ